MALTSDEISATKTDEVDSSSSDDKLPIEPVEMSDEEQKQFTECKEEIPSTQEFLPSDEMQKRQNRLKTRSVSFAPTVQEFEIPSRLHSSFSSSELFIDALVDSYKLQTSNHFFPLHEEKKYVPKTIRTRLTPHWREHRIRQLMNKLEEISLWDREEELKVTQAQFLREQKLEQIQDRQRNNDLCLHLMRQRHESEMESAVLLDRSASCVNDENTKAIIARTKNLISPADVIAYDLPSPPHTFKRRGRQEQEKVLNVKTPVGRYRQFETKMNNKMDKINQKLQPDWEIMRAYSPYRTSIPPTVVPLFSETYSALTSVPNKYSSNRHNRYHYDVSNYSNQSPQHASSPDYETRLRSHSNRDVRVPLKEEASDNDSDEDNHSRSNSSSSKRSTNSVSGTASSLYNGSTLGNTSRENLFIHSRQPISNNIHHRSLNDDLNAITQLSLETSKKILRSISESSNGASAKDRASSVPTNKRVTFIDEDDENEENYNYDKSSKTKYQPDKTSLSSTR